MIFDEMMIAYKNVENVQTKLYDKMTRHNDTAQKDYRYNDQTN